MLDKATTVRKGEELPSQPLLEYCQHHLSRTITSIEVSQFPSGYSNLTYLLRVEEEEWVLRRPPIGANVQTGHDMTREYRVLSGLQRVYKQIPTPILLCEEEDVLGAPFYIMERVQGIIIRDNPPPEVQTPSHMKQLSHSAIHNLATIHQLDIQKANLETLGKPNGYVARQVRGWTKRYQRSQTDAIPSMDIISSWLQKHQPAEQAAAIIHNDYKYDNLILDPTTLTIKAVLDWEMATLGCPLMDLGCALAYWVQADDPEDLFSLPLSATHVPGNVTRTEAATLYAKHTNFSIEQLDYYYVYGLWRLAIILQQIYARYKKGHTADTRFANLIDGVRILSSRATHVIRTGEV